jgi:Siphovirus Gp157
MEQMSQTLKSLLIQSADLESQLIEMSGELSPELEQSLMTIEFKVPEKVSNYQRLIDRLEMESENLTARAEKFGKAGATLWGLREKLLSNVKHLMIENELTELKGQYEAFTITPGKSSVEITDLSELPRNYICQTITERPDKEKIHDALKGGQTVPGSKLKETKVLRRKIIK